MVVQCVLDPAVLNAQTVGNFTNLGLSIFAVLCGKNRGVFVDSGNTYSCLTLSPSFQDLVTESDATIASSNDIGMYAFFCFKECCHYTFDALSTHVSL